jgi:predicted HAD superfamily phosphohydrolase YqeG
MDAITTTKMIEAIVKLKNDTYTHGDLHNPDVQALLLHLDETLCSLDRLMSQQTR